MNWENDLRDHSKSGKTEQIKFHDSLKNKLKLWGTNNEECEHFEHSRYLRYHFKELASSIKETRQTYNILLKKRKGPDAA